MLVSCSFVTPGITTRLSELDLVLPNFSLSKGTSTILLPMPRNPPTETTALNVLSGVITRSSGLVGLDALEQWNQMRHSLGGGQAEFSGIAADGVGQLRAIADQPIPDADQHQGRLLLSRLHWHEAHRRAAHRFAQCFGVRGIILAALDVADHCGSISFTVCPNDCSSRAKWWLAPQASIAITVGASFWKNATYAGGSGGKDPMRVAVAAGGPSRDWGCMLAPANTGAGWATTSNRRPNP